MHNCLSAKGFGLVVALGLSLGASARAEQPNLGLWWQVGANGKFMQLPPCPICGAVEFLVASPDDEPEDDAL